MRARSQRVARKSQVIFFQIVPSLAIAAKSARLYPTGCRGNCVSLGGAFMFRPSHCWATGLGAMFAVGLSFSAVAQPDKKVCSALGVGWQYQKKTDTCVKRGEPAKPAECGSGYSLKPDSDICEQISSTILFQGLFQGPQPFVGVQGAFGGSSSNFQVTPPLSVDGTGALANIYGGLLLPIAGTAVAVGPQVGWYGGNINGSTFYAADGFTYSVATRSITTFEALMRIASQQPKGNSTIWEMELGLGAALVNTKVTGTIEGFEANDSNTRAGFTAMVAVVKPIENTPLSFVAQFRYIDLSEANFDIPGMVPISRNIYIGTAGLEWDFNTPTPENSNLTKHPDLRTTNIRY